MARILIIEDNYNSRRLYCEMLLRAGHEVSEAANGKEGVQVYTETMPDLVITDLIMPVKEGLETISELKRSYPEIRIIAISGGLPTGGLDFLPAAKILGATRTLFKPFLRQDLLNAVDEALGQ